MVKLKTAQLRGETNPRERVSEWESAGTESGEHRVGDRKILRREWVGVERRERMKRREGETFLSKIFAPPFP